MKSLDMSKAIIRLLFGLRSLRISYEPKHLHVQTITIPIHFPFSEYTIIPLQEFKGVKVVVAVFVWSKIVSDWRNINENLFHFL